MRIYAIIAAAVAAALLVGCGVSISKVSSSTAKDVISKLTYVKDDRTGLCFAVLSSSQALHLNDSGLTITWVPCEEKVLAAIAR